jgi:hypothetical protein
LPDRGNSPRTDPLDQPETRCAGLGQQHVLWACRRDDGRRSHPRIHASRRGGPHSHGRLDGLQHRWLVEELLQLRPERDGACRGGEGAHGLRAHDGDRVSFDVVVRSRTQRERQSGRDLRGRLSRRQRVSRFSDGSLSLAHSSSGRRRQHDRSRPGPDHRTGRSGSSIYDGERTQAL